jgi:hypothetical protein
MIFSSNLNGLIQSIGAGGHISLKVGERMDIGGVSALVILAMVGLNFVRTASWEAMFCIFCPMLVLY